MQFGGGDAHVPAVGAKPYTVPKRLTTQDASFIYAETRNAPLHIGSVSIFEGTIDLEELARHVESRIHLIPRYRQRLSFAPFNLAHPCWEDDPHFAVERHVNHYQLPDSADEAELIEAAMQIFERPLDRSRPLWEMHLFNGLQGDRSAILWSVHHCMVDGVSGIELLNLLLDFRPDSPPPEPEAISWRATPAMSTATSLVRAAFDRGQDYFDLSRQAAELIATPRSLGDAIRPLADAVMALVRMAVRPPIAAPWNAGMVTQARSLAWLRCPFAEVRAIRSTFGGTVNDVVLAMLGEAAARYLAEHGCRTDGRPLRIGCPVNVRRRAESGALGNRVSMMFAELEAEPMDVVERLRSVSEETRRIREDGEPQGLDLLLKMADLIPPALMGVGSAALSPAMSIAAHLPHLLPSTVARLLAPSAIGINFVATNVPGAQVPQFLGGHRMEDYVGLLPLAGNLGYGVAILSYNQNLYFGLMAEPMLMPDVERMKLHVSQVLDELMSAARRFKSEQASERAAMPVLDAQPAARDGGLARSTAIRSPSSGARGIPARPDITHRR
jgi:diacylglycerol O-acyltransferase / wax synthase